jgi:hypothetical protein
VPKGLFFSSHCSPEYIQKFLAEDQQTQTPQQQHIHKKKKSATPLVQHPWFTPAVGIGILTVALGSVATYFWWKKKQ